MGNAYFPLVSIIVPTYNVEKYVRRCLDSLLYQTLHEIEIILVDDGSTDSSGEICDEYAKRDSRIRVIHQKNSGLGLSRNSGMRIASGKYIGFVDSDDIVSKDMFRILYENAEKSNADISYCGYRRFSDDEEDSLNYNNSIDSIKKWNGEKEIHKYLLDRIGLPPKSKKDNLYGASVCCGIFLRSKLLEINAEFISERQFIAEDMIFDIDVIPFCNSICHTECKLYFYRYNPASLTTTYKADRFYKNVELYHEMNRRLSYKYSSTDVFDSMSRYLITTARIAVIQECRFAKQHGFSKMRNNILRISNQEDLKKVLSKYQWRKLPLKYAVLCFCQKHSLCMLQIILCKFHTH